MSPPERAGRASNKERGPAEMTDTQREIVVAEESAPSDILLTQFPLLDARSMRRQPKTVEELPPELLEQIHDHAVLENGLPYLNTAWASTDRTDTYYTRMIASTLQNFAEDATLGLSIQNSHHTDEQSLGRTYRGTYKHSRGQTPSRTEMDFYIPPGLVVNGTSTDHIIQGIRWGTVSDVSVGFYGGNVRCAMCQKPMMRDLMSLLLFGSGDDEAETRDPTGPCPHLPGLEYNVRDKDGKKTGERTIAVGEIDGAHCAELSFVFDGATPQAKIAGRMVPVFAKAYRMAEIEVLPKDAAMLLEQRYRGVRFPELTTPRFYMNGVRANAEEPTQDEDTREVDGEEEVREVEVMTDDSRARKKDDESPDDEDEDEDEKSSKRSRRSTSTRVNGHVEESPPVAAVASPSQVATATPAVDVRQLLVASGLAPEGYQGEISVRFQEIAREMSDLRDWADVGRQAHEHLIEEVRAAGIRAYGARSFREAAYGPILQRGSFKELQALLEQFEEIGTLRFPSGRGTTDEEESAKPPAETVKVPARAYRS